MKIKNVGDLNDALREWGEKIPVVDKDGNPIQLLIGMEEGIVILKEDEKYVVNKNTTFGNIQKVKVTFEDEEGNILTILKADKKDFIDNLFNIEYQESRGLKKKWNILGRILQQEPDGTVEFNMHFTGKRLPKCFEMKEEKK